MTIGFGVSCETVSVSAASSSCSSGSLETSTRRVLSGDHSKLDTPPGISVRRSASPPERFRRQTWLFPLGSSDSSDFPSPRAATNARYFPSGLNRGCPSPLSSVCVSWMRVDPFQLTMNKSEVLSSLSTFVVPTRYAIHSPSGEIAMSPTCLIRCTSLG